MSVSITWFDHRREPQCAPDPAFPNGMEIELRRDPSRPGCTADLPYPAKRCGVYVVTCGKCFFSIALPTAGRPDDPKRITLPCKLITVRAG